MILRSNSHKHFSTIRKLLSRDNGSDLHRQVIVLAGEESWQNESLKNILSGFENDALWVGEHDRKVYPFVSITKSNSWLGNEKKVVIFDANKVLSPDSLAAISGIVIGGGVFFLLLPCVDKWSEVYSSYFGKRFTQSIRNTAKIIVIEENNLEYEIPVSELPDPAIDNIDYPFLTHDQQQVVERIESNSLSDNPAPIVLISDRGRGKSAALGFAAARLLKLGIKNIAITAPRLRATDIVFKHIINILPEAESARGCIKFNSGTIQFYSPDQLVHENIHADVLLVDEAAAIPVPLLTSFLHQYPQCVYATTVHGYEGTGRGFTLRFFNELDKHSTKWIKLQMNAPIRWAENDPLENWIFDLLCLDAEIQGQDNINDLELVNLKFEKVNQLDLYENSLLLKEVFALMVLAHYRTQPSDLVRLLDDDSLVVYIAKNSNSIIAVALVSYEGVFDKELSEKIYRGERRPAGHLLAQTLTYHCGIEHAATFNYARIMRIAVLPEYQHIGIGSKFIEYIIDAEMASGKDAIGTSFGMKEELMNFWLKLKFNVVRIGFTREQTSGEHAVVMLMGLNKQGGNINKEASKRFLEQISFWSEDVLADLALELNHYFNLKSENEIILSEYEKKDLLSFAETSRNYELCISAINKFVMANKNKISSNKFPDDLENVISKKVLDKKGWKEIAAEMKLSGKESSRLLFKKAINHLLENK